MPFLPEDIERIKTALAEKKHKNDPDLVQLMGLGLVIRTSEEESTFETNLRAQVRDEVVGAEDLPAYHNIERAIAELTGTQKKEGEKASDFLKRVVGPMKDQQKALQDEIDALKKDAGAEDPRIQTLQAELDKRQKEYDKAVREANKQLTDYKLGFERERVRKAVEALPMPGVPEELKADVIEARINRYYAENEIRFNDKGERELYSVKEQRVLMNPTDLTHIDPAEHVLGYVADLKGQSGGDGGSGEKYKGQSGQGDRRKGDYSRARSQVELDEMLMRDGLSSDSDDYIKARESAVKAYSETSGRPMPIRE